ncbi:pyrroline-5-carboxylate reductase dimerization domain-containing protein [Sorangium sp. So ce726]
MQHLIGRGGTTAAAIETLDRHAAQAAFVEAIGNARRRAQELGGR